MSIQTIGTNVKTALKNPKVIIVSQWPEVKNAEYQLIESIKLADVEITVVDFLGNDLASGENLNNHKLRKSYDFAIALHYTTPCLLNLPTYLWISNPLEYLYLDRNYHTIKDNMRAYSDFVFNGSDMLKQQVKNLNRLAWNEHPCNFYPSSARAEILPPTEAIYRKKIFYCGINWEACSGKGGRYTSLFHALHQKKAISIFGPRIFCGVDVWKDVSCYEGEIPFDGTALKNEMRDYTAVLALSSPAHIRSQTSSSRVFEALSAGVPVISDENPHVKKLFGDLVYYVPTGDGEMMANEIERVLQHIDANPEEASERVLKAQDIIAEQYSYEPCLQALFTEHKKRFPDKPSQQKNAKVIEFNFVLYHHDPTVSEDDNPRFDNLIYCIKALEEIVKYGHRGHILLIYPGAEIGDEYRAIIAATSISVQCLSGREITSIPWCDLKLGQKMQLMAALSKADYTSFINQCEFPHFDYFLNLIKNRTELKDGDLNIVGTYYAEFSDQSPRHKKVKKRPHVDTIKRCNRTLASMTYDDSFHELMPLGRMIFSKKVLRRSFLGALNFFDILTSTALFFLVKKHGYQINSICHLTLRVERFIFENLVNHDSLENHGWSYIYQNTSILHHEINAGYNLFDSDKELFKIWSSFDKGTVGQAQTVVSEKVVQYVERRSKIAREIRRIPVQIIMFVFRLVTLPKRMAKRLYKKIRREIRRIRVSMFIFINRLIILTKRMTKLFTVFIK